MIKLSKIYKSFDKRVVLSDVTLSVSNNEYVCITGESGAGKTTLLNLILVFFCAMQRLVRSRSPM